jgi:hypothetical protein
MRHAHLRPSFETPRKCAAPQDEGAYVALWNTGRAMTGLLVLANIALHPDKRHRRPRIVSRESEFHLTSLEK